LGKRGTNEVADVSVIEAIGNVWSYPCTYGCVLTTINVSIESRSANCRVVIAIAVSSRVIILKREITNSGIRSRNLISKERGIAHGIVTESGSVTVERKGADSAVERSVAGSVACVIEQCGRSNSCVSVAKDIEQKTGSANTRVRIPLGEEHRCSTDASIEVPALGGEEHTPTKRCITGTEGSVL
jgi:hypothetical protein